MKVLVTGGTGFIGVAVVKAIAARGHEVLACGHSSGTHCDLLDPRAAEELLKAELPEGLIHLAWNTSHGTYWTSPENLRWAGASLFLLEAFARYGGKRALIAGSSAEYRWDGEHTLSEFESALEPDSLYGSSKNALREILESWAPAAGVSLGWARLFCPFGPGEKVSRLIPKLISRLASGAVLDFDSGSLIRDFLHVDDLAEAFAALFDSGVVGAVNLASGEDTTIRQIVEWIASSFNAENRVRFGTQPDPLGLPLRVVADIRRLREEVGWSPPFSIAERIRQTCLTLKNL
jgi:nucleoside-diphosphate-sugar epimerase